MKVFVVVVLSYMIVTNYPDIARNGAYTERMQIKIDTLSFVSLTKAVKFTREMSPSVKIDTVFLCEDKLGSLK